MSKTKKPPKPREAIPKLSIQPPESATAPAAPWFRETVESIVIAFVLAFLFRTFEAEAFVIPTGSMAPTLMGRHKDVYCSQCGHRFQVTASEEESEEALQARVQRGPQAAADFECVAGVCPMCRYTMPMRTNLPKDWVVNYPAADIRNQKSYNGDRILVNKYVYTLDDPKRWDIVVFHFPGDAQMNYIKRLVGLPGETLRIFQGDLFTKRDDAGAKTDFQIEHKPADKVLAMRQLVHDTNYDPSLLYTAGWPLRWSGADASGGWQATADASGENVRQRYSLDSKGDDTRWLRYRNYVPDFAVWQEIGAAQRRAKVQGGSAAKLTDSGPDRWRSQLVMDFNAYNTRVTLGQAKQFGSLAPPAARMGIHWVGDLMVVADVDVEAARGELVLDLVEGGQHFTCTIDLVTGQAKLGAGGLADYAPTAKTVFNAPGKYRVGLANFDDQLMLFVKERSMLMPDFRAGDAVSFEGGTAYDADLVFGNRNQIAPETSEEDPGDLAPAGVGARGAKLSVDRLQVWRDIYYIADSSTSRQNHSHWPITDLTDLNDQLPFNPSLWPNLRNRNSEEFPLTADQFFVMGDNSPESSDARLWLENGRGGGRPGGHYLERRLLIGKALCVYWPHSWNRIPGTPIPFPLFPNFEDMRLVR